MDQRLKLAISLFSLASLAPLAAHAGGARSFKSGPIQVTADGTAVWLVNPHSDSVSRIDTATYGVTEYALPAPAAGGHRPRGLSVSEDGSEVWVACHDSDQVIVLNAADGSMLASLYLPWGSGPYSVALSRPDPGTGKQRFALVTLHRGAALAAIDVQTRSILKLLSPVFWAPLGVAWMEDGVSAWVTHPFADIEGPYLTRVDFSNPSDPKVTTKLHVLSSLPITSVGITNPPAEGGYLMQRGHLAQIPSASGRNEVWLPTQYSNIHDDDWTPDSAFQAVIRHLDLATRTLPNTNNDKVILSAVNVHDPTSPLGGTYVGPGWGLGVAGPVDIGFSADGAMTYLLNELSDDLVILRSTTGAVFNAATPVYEVAAGSHPMGLAVSPVADVAFVANEWSADVSVIDLTAHAALRPPVPVTALPFAGGPVLTGARLFHTSEDRRISYDSKAACASCHPHGESDGRGWALQQTKDASGLRPSPHGPRNTMSLLGLALTDTPGQTDPATGWGELHRSGDRDEVQDFDHTFRGEIMGGTGFIASGICPEVVPPDPACSNQGKDVSGDLDALAAYVMQLPPIPKSPLRDPSGALSPAAIRGATFFLGADPANHPADAGCAGCHVPETGFVDFAFHDVGTYRDPKENELNKRTPAWAVNTPTLIGVWATAPWDGVNRFLGSMTELIKDFALAPPARTIPHGTLAGLTRRQQIDLAAFVQSIDGLTTALEVRGARDGAPPHIVRAEPASLTRVDVWFDETVDPASSANPASWRIEMQGGGIIPVTAATYDPQNGDHVTLTTALERGCAPIVYTVVPQGPIYDVADRASGGARNALDVADPANLRPFTIGDTLTVTLGASGYENITVKVHDVSILGNAGVIGGGSMWLDRAKSRKGFLRFAWEGAFAAATGVTASADIVDADFSLVGEFGNSQPLELRRVLQAWSDVAVGESDFTTPGRVTWTHRVYNTSAWNAAGAAALGGNGAQPSDYNGSADVASTLDATYTMPSINERETFAGPSIAAAFRFWFDNPTLDYGYMIELAAGATSEMKITRSEREFGADGPVLRITYRLPASTQTIPTEVSGPAGGSPLLMVKRTGTPQVGLDFEDLGTGASGYNVYEGTIGTWYSHTGTGCGITPGLAGTRRDWTITPGAGSRYYQVTASDGCGEGPATPSYPPALNDCPG